MPRSKFTRKDIEDMRKLYKKGIGWSEIGRRYGVTRTTIRQHVTTTKGYSEKRLADGIFKPLQVPHIQNSRVPHIVPKKISGKSYLDYLKEDAERRGVPFKKPKETWT